MIENTLIPTVSSTVSSEVLVALLEILYGVEEKMSERTWLSCVTYETREVLSMQTSYCFFRLTY